MLDPEGYVLSAAMTAVCAGGLDEQVTNHGGQRALRVRCDCRADHVVIGRLKQRDLMAVVACAIGIAMFATWLTRQGEGRGERWRVGLAALALSLFGWRTDELSVHVRPGPRRGSTARETSP